MTNKAGARTSSDFTIEEVSDLSVAWAELEPLVLGIVEYHRPWDQRRLRSNWADIMREYMAAQCVTLLARSASGQPIGFLRGTVRADYGIFEGVEGHVDNAFVVGPMRGSGVGRSLYQQFEAICLARGTREVYLDVALDNEVGDSFWRTRGFMTAMRQMKKSLEVPA